MVTEEVVINADQNIDDIERFLLRSGKYIDSGYKLKDFSCIGGLSATFYIDTPPRQIELGFDTSNNEKEDLDAKP